MARKLPRPGGPILILIGGEGEANVAWMGAGSWLGEYTLKHTP
jgi:hypothetical protein